MGPLETCKLIVSAVMCILAFCASAATIPSSLPIGTSMTTADTTAASVTVLDNGNFIVSLEGNPCAITVRNQVSPEFRHLVWTANYFVGSPGSFKECTLRLTKDGDLQLLGNNGATTTRIWHSGTTGRGVKRMALDESANAFYVGDFRLLDAQNKIVWRSFAMKEFAILPTQKLMPSDTLVAPDALFDDRRNQTLFSGGVYSLKLQNGDLRLYSNFGKGTKLYWSLKRTSLFKGDLSQVAYAAVTKQGAIGLFRADGSIMYSAGGAYPPNWENVFNTYFSVDADGNLRTYYFYRGSFWDSEFLAMTSCELPNFCGPNGICSESAKFCNINGYYCTLDVCSCPPSFKAVNASDRSQGCAPMQPVSACNAGKQNFQKLTGVNYIYNQYTTPLKVTVSTCQSKCSIDCSCVAYFYDTKAGLCYMTNELKTLQKVSAATQLAFIKI